jgi:hypothetical protein
VQQVRTHPTRAGAAAAQRNDSTLPRAPTNPKSKKLSRENTFLLGQVSVEIERHTWMCELCKKGSELISTLLTETEDFNQMLFRDHDLMSPSCGSQDLIVWGLGGRKYAFMQRRGGFYKYQNDQLGVV